MKTMSKLKFLSIFLVAAYLLSACSGAAQSQGNPTGGGKSQPSEVAFTGTVEAIGADSVTVSGQVVSIDAKTMLDQNIQVGDIVKVEGHVSDDGTVLAVKVESFGADDSNTNAANDNSANANDTGANTNADDNTNAANDNGNANANSNSNDNSAGLGSGTEQEITGVVDAIAADSVTVNGVTYQFASFTEFKQAIAVGDQVKLHVIVNADGSLTVREIEKFAGTSMGDDNSNTNVNSDDSNSNGNGDDSNDDHGNDNGSNTNSDDNGGNGNGNSGGGSNGNSNSDD